MAEALPLTPSSSQLFYLNAEGRELLFRVRWSPATGHWYLSVSVNGEEVTLSRQITLGALLLRDRRFPGDVVCRSLNNAKDEPARNAWGVTHQLVRLTTAELDRILD